MNHGRQAGGLLVACLATLIAWPVKADSPGVGPLMSLHAEHAMNAIFGLPGAAARTVADRGWQLSLEHGNQFLGSRHGTDCLPQSAACESDANEPARELLYLDGETSELGIRYRQAFDACWQGQFQVSFLQHHGGVFDRAIEDWHDVFGMPDAGRQFFETDQLTYRYADASGERLRIDRPQSGVGDIILSAQRSIGCADTRAASERHSILRFGLKLPAGSLSSWLGSGRADAFVDVQSPIWNLRERGYAAASLGLLWVGQNARLPDQEPVVGYGTAGLQWRMTSRFQALAQIDWHTPFYRSELPELGEATVVLSTGLRYQLSAAQSLEITISEDIKVESAPDIVGRLAWIHHP